MKFDVLELFVENPLQLLLSATVITVGASKLGSMASESSHGGCERLEFSQVVNCTAQNVFAIGVTSLVQRINVFPFAANHGYKKVGKGKHWGNRTSCRESLKSTI
jgi:hypothetical protein